jgi:hypothetical protein
MTIAILVHGESLEPRLTTADVEAVARRLTNLLRPKIDRTAILCSIGWTGLSHRSGDQSMQVTAAALEERLKHRDEVIDRKHPLPSDVPRARHRFLVGITCSC